MNNKIKNLLLAIAKCDEVEKAKSSNDHPCNKIVCSQDGEFQLPEPWNGHLDTAEILFISSNPSIDPNENYPTANCNDEDITSFFENRFENTPKNQWSTYWRTILKWAGWIIPNIGFDKIAITEIVHCKSQKEFGVYECMNFCAEKWLNEVLSVYNGKYIVLVGKVAQNFYNKVKENCPNKIIIQTPHFARPVKGLTDEKRKQDFLNQLN